MRKIFSEEIDEDEDEFLGKFKMTHTILDIIPETEEDKNLFKNWEKDNFHIERFKTKKGYRLILYTKTEVMDE